MKKVLILGATGMLGSAMYEVLKDKYELILGVRSMDKLSLLESAYGKAPNSRVVPFDAAKLYDDYINKKGSPSEYLNNFLKEVGEVDYVLNAIGVTIPFSMKEPALTFFTNGALPHIFSGIFGARMIHITTDCAFNGKAGFPYDENSLKSPVDIYGLSKSLGEPVNCLTLRTSIIGRELDGFTGFLEWFRSQEGKTLTGFANHFWNGVTTKEFANICDRIMQDRSNFPSTGLYHVFSTTVSKYEMLTVLQAHYGINCEINKDEEQKLDRTLATIHAVKDKLNIPSFEEMVKAL